MGTKSGNEYSIQYITILYYRSLKVQSDSYKIQLHQMYILPKKFRMVQIQKRPSKTANRTLQSAFLRTLLHVQFQHYLIQPFSSYRIHCKTQKLLYTVWSNTLQYSRCEEKGN